MCDEGPHMTTRSVFLRFSAGFGLPARYEACAGPTAEDYMEGMIPHQSIAILTSERAGIVDLRVADLADGIIQAQREEIAEMEWLLRDIEKNGPATTQNEAKRRPVPDRQPRHGARHHLGQRGGSARDQLARRCRGPGAPPAPPVADLLVGGAEPDRGRPCRGFLAALVLTGLGLACVALLAFHRLDLR